MRILSLFIFCIILSGCTSTPNDARKSSPILNENTSKSVRELSECIADKWENNKFAFEYDHTVNTKIKNNVTTVYTWKNSYFADITNLDSGSNVKMFSAAPGALLLKKDREKLLRLCL